MQYDKHFESLEYDKMQYDKLFSFFYHIDFENMIKKNQCLRASRVNLP